MAENKAASEWEEEMVPVPVDSALLSDLMEMGFSDVRARKGLVHGNSLDGALAWLSEHQDDADIDQPYMVWTLSISISVYDLFSKYQLAFILE